ncbi:hypothetical protein BDB00DRAFT_874911 [Zychaea mexicana]|uniref:uncharacterized protein n=1 Tax=Zychaea mexicana TaxID=64656 RepID=UPI0022FDC885|nr:uncharacterized protein BDB00DRAFT_874911 [Zychaea mexicana]KAI9490912.1 hypothetical protein BDB00DRAFT_874911 [Zychaea mexicana]
MTTEQQQQRYPSTPTTDAATAAQFHLMPAPQTNESFYFNQEPISAVIYENDHGIQQQIKMETASVHLTDQRLILLLQDRFPRSSNTATTLVSTFQIDLGHVASLKCRLTFRCGIQLSLYLVDSATPVRIQLVFAKKDRNRRDAFKEYLNMIMAGLTSRKRVLAMHRQLSSQLMHHHHGGEQLPSYDQALSDTTIMDHHRHHSGPTTTSTAITGSNNNDNSSSIIDILPPAYST